MTPTSERADRPVIPTLDSYSAIQLGRIYRAAHDRMSYQLGTSSWDWPTLRMLSPSWARTLHAILTALRIARTAEQPKVKSLLTFIDNASFDIAYRCACRGSQYARNKVVRLGKGYMLPGPCVATLQTDGSVKLS